MTDKYAYFEDRLSKTLEQRRVNQLHCIVQNKPIHGASLDFATQDILGLSAHDFVKKQAIKAVLQWGAGSLAHRHLSSHATFQRKIEDMLAKELGHENTLLFSGTLQIHNTILPTLVTPRTVVYIDRFASPSLFQLIRPLTRNIVRFEHNAVGDVQRHLESHSALPTHQKLIVTESLFTQTGMYAPLNDFIEVAEKHSSLLYVDDSNTMGINGSNGFGYASQKKGIDFVVGSFGRTGGCYGAFLALPSCMRDFLLTANASLAATSPLPPAVLGAIHASVQLIPDMHYERTQLKEKIRYVRKALDTLGIPHGDTHSHIIPLFFSSDDEKKTVAEYLENASIFLQQSQKEGGYKPSLRIRLASTHSTQTLDTLLSSLKKALSEVGVQPPSYATSYIP